MMPGPETERPTTGAWPLLSGLVISLSVGAITMWLVVPVTAGLVFLWLYDSLDALPRLAGATVFYYANMYCFPLTWVTLAAASASYLIRQHARFRWWGEVVALGAVGCSLYSYLDSIRSLPPVTHGAALHVFIHTIVTVSFGGAVGGQVGRWLRRRKRSA